MALKILCALADADRSLHFDPVHGNAQPRGDSPTAPLVSAPLPSVGATRHSRQKGGALTQATVETDHPTAVGRSLLRRTSHATGGRRRSLGPAPSTVDSQMRPWVPLHRKTVGAEANGMKYCRPPCERETTSPPDRCRAEVALCRTVPARLRRADVLAEITPDGWEKSPLLACFHPSPEQVFKEQLQVHRNLEKLIRHRPKQEPDPPAPAPRQEPTLEEVRADWKETAVNTSEESTELVGQCLWDLFPDNHEVITADGRFSDIGSVPGASKTVRAYF